jgi:4-amino-4-deoxy-L-arabinose transferase-like glycosyltransferase
MNGILAFLALLLSAGILFIMPSEGAPALLVGAVLAFVAILLISRTDENRTFLIRLFIGGLLVRILVGSLIYAFHAQEFFGGDANTYDFFGFALLKSWQGDAYYGNLVNTFIGQVGSSAWGMLYMVASLYWITGRDMLAVQFINAIFGAATAVVIFLCARHIFKNTKVARFSGIFVAFYPSLVLWSSQGLKDGPIVFLLALCMLATLKLGERLSVKYLIMLACSLFALLSMRFYIFYMMAAAVCGAFVIGMRQVSAQSLLRQLVVLVVVGISLTYFGVGRYTNVQFEAFGNLETLQRSRLDQAQTAQSGFGADADVSTASGALSILPTGILNLLFAPFPWQMASLRQSITLPEMVIWWASFPFLVLGLWFTIRYRLRQVSPILIFTAMLTLAYSMFQGNIGTAYRQRAQLLVFYFIFVAVGIVLIQEKRENKKRRELMDQIEKRAAAEALARRRRSLPHQWKEESEGHGTKEKLLTIEDRAG